MTSDNGFTRVTLTDQLTSRIRQDIASGLYPPGTMLPSEKAMTDTHGVSRPVVRAAIAALTNEGLIRPIQGKGSFVRAISAPELVIARTPGNPWAALLPEGKPTAHVDNADAYWSTRFDVPVGSVIYRSEQTMTHPGGRRFHTIRTLPSLRLEAVGTAPGPDPFQDRATLLDLLAKHYGRLFEEDRTQSAMPSPDYVALLAIPPGTPVSVVTRLTLTRQGVVLMAETERTNAEGIEYGWRLT